MPSRRVSTRSLTVYLLVPQEHNYKFAVGDAEVKAGKGFFIQPTIIDNPPDDSRIVQEEPFGPIVPTLPWTDEEDVIKRANATNTGLGACVWGKDLAKAESIGRRLEAGSVFINSWEKPTPQAFFGGHKESGIGGEWGGEGLKAYCNAHVSGFDTLLRFVRDFANCSALGHAYLQVVSAAFVY